MTVAELIAKLQKMPQDLPVWIQDSGYEYEPYELRNVEHDTLNIERVDTTGPYQNWTSRYEEIEAVIL